MLLFVAIQSAWKMLPGKWVGVERQAGDTPTCPHMPREAGKGIMRRPDIGAFVYLL